MGKISLTIDDQKISVEEGISLLLAAKEASIEIPHLCFREGLNPQSSCRLCVVEVEGVRNLVASCSYPVREGMVVKTNTLRVQEARKLVLELILSDHPQECMTCEKSGSCELEKYAYNLGVSSSRFLGERHQYPPDLSNPFIERDYNKCILCGRCVTVCKEVQCSDVIDFSYRGFETRIATAFDRPLSESPCVFCGQCVGVCPVGALSEKERKFKGREWELKRVQTICSYCGVGCNIELNIKDDQIVKITSPIDSPVNKGNLCVKGRFGFEYVHSPERLSSPLIKEGEGFREASWKEALGIVAGKLKEIKGRYGSDSLALLSSAKATNEENYLLQKFARAVLGTNNIDHCARL